MISDWKEFFDEIKGKEYSKSLKTFLDSEYSSHVVYPPRELMFNAFAKTSPSSIKAVIIGQDPYHNPGQAMGLSFSVPKGEELPPSLINIYKEIEIEFGIRMDMHNGDLTSWANQGVLLLNSYLTVRKNEPLSHAIKEYEEFSKDVLSYLDKLNQPIVFFLWGSFAKKRKEFIRNPKRLILEAVHPSPLSANRGGWFNKGMFKQANDYLTKEGSSPIDWKI